MKTSFKLKQSLKQTIHLSKGMQTQINMLSMNRLELSSLLSDIASKNPFLEYTCSNDISQFIEETIYNKPSLQDELYYQLHTSSFNYSPEICEYIIESLDDKGFFNYNLSEICKDLNILENEFMENLKIIQSLEPIGVAAKSSIDSIIIQLRYKNQNNAAFMLENYGKEIENNQYEKISKQMNIDTFTIYEYLNDIRFCNPFPCQEYSSHKEELIIPELEIRVEDEDIIIEPKEIGQVSLNEYVENPKDKIIKEYFNQAKFYVDSLNRRNKTLLILSNELFSIQKSHFIYNDELHPCKLKDIANNTNFSLSTVSRIFSKKYYLFNDNLYPFKDLFISSTKEGSSKDSIQKAIIYLIDNENKEKPFLDEELVTLLKDMELFVSRRTIAKYRNQLKIPNSKQRKKLHS